MGILSGRRKSSLERIEVQKRIEAREKYTAAYRSLRIKVEDGERLRKLIEEDGGNVQLPAFGVIEQARTEIIDDTIYRMMNALAIEDSRRQEMIISQLHQTLAVLESVTEQEGDLYEYNMTMSSLYGDKGVQVGRAPKIARHLQEVLTFNPYGAGMMPKDFDSKLTAIRDSGGSRLRRRTSETKIETVDLHELRRSFEEHMRIVERVQERYEHEGSKLQTMVTNIDAFVATVDTAIYELNRYRIDHAIEIDIDDIMDQSLFKSPDVV